MKVDISPNFPPSSSWTIEAPFGSGSVGGGISACRRSSRMIIRASPRCSGRNVREWVPDGMRDTRKVSEGGSESEAERHGKERAAAAQERAEHARERARVARREAAEADDPRAAQVHLEEAKIHEDAAQLHEAAEELQEEHVEEHSG